MHGSHYKLFADLYISMNAQMLPNNKLQPFVCSAWALRLIDVDVTGYFKPEMPLAKEAMPLVFF